MRGIILGFRHEPAFVEYHWLIGPVVVIYDYFWDQWHWMFRPHFLMERVSR